MQTQTVDAGSGRPPKQGPEFSTRLATALEQLNMSRVALARELAVDKAVVSRWLAGENRPTEHNLTRLTELVRRSRPHFSLADWRGPDERFQRALESRQLLTAPDFAPGRLILQGLQTPPMPRRWQTYFGTWVGFYSSLLNDGALLMWGMRIHADELGLRFQTSFGPLGGEGPALISGGRLHLLTEVAPLHDRIAYFVFNAVYAPQADLLDGLIAVPAGDPDGTPTATLLRAVRVGGADGDSELDIESLGKRIRCHNKTILGAIAAGRTPLDAVSAFAPRELVARVAPRVGASASSGTDSDHVLRMPVGHRPSRALIETAKSSLREAFGVKAGAVAAE